ncbi:MAG: AAA family ATPase [Clostridia bacterium]|nr:AAA family ATPase [Clostridia bacterium]
MKSEKLELKNFGKFRDASVELGDGLNVLYAPNETGKSTLAGFIRYMLYGFPKNERSSATNPITTAQRFKPWQGGETAGSMVFSAGNRRVTVVRDGAKSVRAYDTVTTTDIPLTREIGEEMYGLSLDTFESTAFFGQSALHRVSMEELEDKLKNMVTGADESVSYEKARQALHKAKNKIDSGRAGALPELRKEITDLSYRIEQVRQEQANLNGLAQECDRLTEQITAAQAERQALEDTMAKRQAQMDREFLQSKDALLQQAQEAAKAEQQALEHLGGLTRSDVDRLNLKSQRLTALRDVLGQIQEPTLRKKPIWLLIVGILLAVAGAAVALAVSVFGLSAVGLGGAAIVGYAILAGRVNATNAESQGVYERAIVRHQEAADLHRSLSQVFGEQPDYTMAISALYDDLVTAAEQQMLARQWQERAATMDAEAFRRADAEYLSLCRQKEQGQQEEQRLALMLTEKKAQWEERTRHAGSLDLLISEYNEKQQRQTALEKELAAYQLALESLDGAHLEMTHLYAPMLADRTAAFFSEMTGKHDRRIAVDVGGKVRVEEKDTGARRTGLS